MSRRRFRHGLWLLLLDLLLGGPKAASASNTSVTVDNALVIRQMAYGFGQNWHVMLGPEDSPITISGWGAVPAGTDDVRWGQVFRFADWLGINFIRLEIEQRMYEGAGKDVFNWESGEMRSLYRVLDWCESNQVDVLLFEMWPGCTWNVPAGADPYTTSPQDGVAWARGFATLVDHLVHKRNHKCIRLLGVFNEPGDGRFRWAMPWEQYVELVRRELDQRGLSMPLAGPDNWGGPFRSTSRLGAYENHVYGVNAETAAACTNWITGAHAAGLPFFLGEYGIAIPGARQSNHTYKANLGEAAWLVNEINAGCDGFLRWEFLNVGVLDGDWQMIDTYNPASNSPGGTNGLYQTFHPHPNSFYVQGLFSRFTPKHSATLKSASEDGELKVAAFRTPGTNYSIYLVNLGDADKGIQLTLTNWDREITLYRYAVTPAAKDLVHVTIAPTRSFTLNRAACRLSDTVTARSLIVYSSFKLSADAKGVFSDDAPLSSVPRQRRLP